MFSLPTTVTVSNTEYPVRTDFRVILEIFVMLEDPDLNDSDKTEALLRMFYEDRPPAQDTDAALRAFLETAWRQFRVGGVPAPTGEIGPYSRRATTHALTTLLNGVATVPKTGTVKAKNA